MCNNLVSDAIAMQSSVTLYTTSIPTTLRKKTAIRRLESLLHALRVEYAMVDVAQEPHRLKEMLQASGGDGTLPQLHCNGVFIGDMDTIEEQHDFGELLPLLKQ